jgi:hypothetical protein
MDNVDYVIIGTEPYSLTLAYYLSKINKKCMLIENENSNTNQKKIYYNSYFNFIYLLRNFEINFNDLFIPSTIQFSISSFSFGELLLIFSEFITLFFSDSYSKNITIEEFINKNNFSIKSKIYISKFINIQSRLYELLEMFNVISLYRIYEPIESNNNLIENLKNKIIENNNVIISTDNIYNNKEIELNEEINSKIIVNNKIYTNIDLEITDALELLYILEPQTKKLFKNYKSDNFIDIIKFVLLVQFILFIFRKVL